VVNNVLNIKNIDNFLEVMKNRFLEKIKGQPYFRITSTPTALKTRLNVQDATIINLLKNPPSTRKAGWNLEVVGIFKPTLEGIENSDYDWCHIILLKNAHLEFWAKIDESFCWRQNEMEMKVHPRLYPYAVIEYPVNFFRFLKRLIEITGIKSDILIGGGYYNCRGCHLRPGHPESIIFQNYRVFSPKYWDSDDPIEFTSRKISTDFIPDQEAYKTVSEIYAAFGIEEKYIPLFDDNKEFLP